MTQEELNKISNDVYREMLKKYDREYVVELLSKSDKGNGKFDPNIAMIDFFTESIHFSASYINKVLSKVLVK